MLTKARAGIGLGVISLAAAFAYFTKPAEPPVAEQPGPFARYLQEVNQRLEAQNSWGATGAIVPASQDAAGLPVTAPAAPAEATSAFTPLSEQSDIARHAAGFSSPHVGVAATSYSNVYRALKDQINPDEASRAALGMDWKTFVAQVDAASAREQQDMALKVNSLVNIEQGAAHLRPEVRCQLNANIQSLVGAIQTRIDLREASGSPLGAADIAALHEERKRTFTMADMVRSSGPGCVSSGLIVVARP